ncbi:MAG: TrmH family RNA methyltransferase [Candidatus Sericytochromatia bacterium]|nr:TrmH family RNA methyltransferase [Candidatus Sericytochromatia bacterium]
MGGLTDRVVLVHPTLPDNVGMVARAMAAYGWTDLVLVGGVAPTHPLALAAAPGGEDVLRSARVVASLPEALEGTGRVFGTTARVYVRPAGVTIGPAEALAMAPVPGPVAWVFGSERTGLGVAERAHLPWLVRLPAPGPSLNLAQAVTALITLVAMERERPAPEPSPVRPNHAAVPWADETTRRALAGALARYLATDEDSARAKTMLLCRMLDRLPLAPDEAGLVAALVGRTRRTGSEAR